jgi:ribosomal protein S18
MNSSDSNTSLPTDQSKPSQQNVLERVADRSAKKTFFEKNMVAICWGKKIINYKNPEMLSCYQSSHHTLVENCQ